MDCQNQLKRVNLFLGHYGSGKTNLAVNFAINIAKTGKPVRIFDLDIVNPYFRTLDAKDMLNKNKIELISSDYSNTNVDIPAITPKMYNMLDKDYYAVVDIGGDDRGAYALGRYQDEIILENDYDMFLVINAYRIETRTVEDALIIKQEIESATKLHFTGIINNSHLGTETTEADILASLPYAREISLATGLEVRYTTVRNDLYDLLENKIENILPIELIPYGNW